MKETFSNNEEDSKQHEHDSMPSLHSLLYQPNIQSSIEVEEVVQQHQQPNQESVIQKMLNELKNKKQQELMKSQSPSKGKGQSPKTIKQKQSTRKQEQIQQQPKEVLFTAHQLSQEDAKAKKLDELKKQLLESRPYATTVTPPLQTEEASTNQQHQTQPYKSESTVFHAGAIDYHEKQTLTQHRQEVKSAVTPKRGSKPVYKPTTPNNNVGNKESQNVTPNRQQERKSITPVKKHIEQQQQINRPSVSPSNSNSSRRPCIMEKAGSPSQKVLSEKTQQIFFKKLQKDVEISIRTADSRENGSLNMEEFKNCLFNMEYLPFMQEEASMQRNYIVQNQMNTAKGMVLQEKEFVYNFWCILNPLNQEAIDNALLYDVLLLMIFNVQQPVNQSVSFLTEYLENLYLEKGVNLEILGGGYYSGNLSDMGTLSNISRYLSYCNLWSLEKLAIEFKKVHANKVSHMFSNRNQRVPPSPTRQNETFNKLNLQSSPHILINPTDGRKYKKAVVEDHLSQLTFSPSITSKTKQLDQQLTERYLKEVPRQYRRDASADILAARNISFFNEPPEGIVRDSDEEQEEANGPQAFQNGIKRYDLLLYRQMITNAKLEQAKENKLQKILEECTFQPNAHVQRNQPGLQGSKSYRLLQQQVTDAFGDISQKIKQQRSKLFDHTQSSRALCHPTTTTNEKLLEKELQQCTFKPTINNRTPKKFEEVITPLPKGYNAMVNRMRKVNEERKALEEKQQKKAVGENYERLKLMNIKPPSFLQEEINAKKKKRQLLMYVDVNITPNRTGRIGIYEGDDIRELAKNFQKTFQLNQTMYSLLVQQLEGYLQAYLKKIGYSKSQGTSFPSQRQGDEMIIERTNESEVSKGSLQNLVDQTPNSDARQQYHDYYQREYEEELLHSDLHRRREVNISELRYPNTTSDDFREHVTTGNMRQDAHLFNLGASSSEDGHHQIISGPLSTRREEEQINKQHKKIVNAQSLQNAILAEREILEGMNFGQELTQMRSNTYY